MGIAWMRSSDGNLLTTNSTNSALKADVSPTDGLKITTLWGKVKYRRATGFSSKFSAKFCRRPETLRRAHFWFVRNRLLERAGQDESNGCDHMKRRTRPSHILQFIMYPSFTDDLPHRPMPGVLDPEYRGRYPEMVLIPISPCFLYIFFSNRFFTHSFTTYYQV